MRIHIVKQVDTRIKYYKYTGIVLIEYCIVNCIVNVFQEKLNRKELIQEGLKELREELSKWKGEVKEKFEDDPIIVRPGEMWIMVLWIGGIFLLFFL